jgi:hypothetical protein
MYDRHEIIHDIVKQEIENSVGHILMNYLFECNTAEIRNKWKKEVEEFLSPLVSHFEVKCDETNNTKEVLDEHGFIGEIYYKINVDDPKPYKITATAFKSETL